MLEPEDNLLFAIMAGLFLFSMAALLGGLWVGFVA